MIIPIGKKDYPTGNIYNPKGYIFYRRKLFPVEI